MKAKNICNLVIIALLAIGVGLILYDNEKANTYINFLLGITPLIGAWMGAIWGGKWIQHRYNEYSNPNPNVELNYQSGQPQDGGQPRSYPG